MNARDEIHGTGEVTVPLSAASRHKSVPARARCANYESSALRALQFQRRACCGSPAIVTLGQRPHSDSSKTASTRATGSRHFRTRPSLRLRRAAGRPLLPRRH